MLDIRLRRAKKRKDYSRKTKSIYEKEIYISCKIKKYLKKVNVNSNGEKLSCIIDLHERSSEINTIILHGGGPSTKENTEYLLPVLQKNGKFSIRFDFSGQGESSGDLLKSSLHKRFNEAKKVINELIKTNKCITIIGTSMAGHIACALASEFSVDNLILFCPAAYSVKAWDIPFGNCFTEIIRENGSYLQNNISELLADYSGKIMLILAEDDQIIPIQVVDIYKEEIRKRNDCKLYIIKNSPHPIHKWIINNSSEKDKLLAEIDSFLKKKLSNNCFNVSTLCHDSC